MTASPCAQAAQFSTTSPDAIHLHLQALNGLNHAAHLLAYGELTPRNLNRAIGKATRAATALKRLAAAEQGEG